MLLPVDRSQHSNYTGISPMIRAVDRSLATLDVKFVRDLDDDWPQKAEYTDPTRRPCWRMRNIVTFVELSEQVILHIIIIVIMINMYSYRIVCTNVNSNRFFFRLHINVTGSSLSLFT